MPGLLLFAAGAAVSLRRDPRRGGETHRSRLGRYATAMTMATITAITTTTPAISTGGDTGERRAREVSWSPRSTKARNRPVLALGSCSYSDMWTTLAGQRLARCRIRRNFR